MIDDHATQTFQTAVWDYYHAHGRHDLPWRQPWAGTDDVFDPYAILVSELMLQQTQVARVMPKYQQFMKQFPTAQALAAAPLGTVLWAWNGLGYNRRAKFLHQAAGQIMSRSGGEFPQQSAALVELPGVGANTAGAILAYAFNQPVVFIETNIRTVFIHHFFHGQIGITDKAILEFVGATLDKEQPREWYWALMDYGAYLKQTVGNPNLRSAGYAKQSIFHGSRRQLRGQVIRLLGERPRTAIALRRQLEDDRLTTVLTELLAEGLIRKHGETYRL